MAFENAFTHGNLVDLNIKMWTAERKLQPEDLGLDEVSVAEVFTLGRKKLIPSEIIKKMRFFDYQARACLIEHSFPFAFGSARFVPKKRFLDFVEAIEKIRSDFNKAADEIAENYTKYKLEVRGDYVKAAEEAYKRLAYIHKGFEKSKEEYVNEFLDRVDKTYPSEDEIRSKYNLDYTVFQAALPDITEASYEDIAEEEDKRQLLEDVYRKSLYRKVEEFIDNVVYSQREKATKALNHFCEILSKGKKVQENSCEAVRKMIDEYGKMDFVGDDEFYSKLVIFKDRTLGRYTAKQLHSSAKLRQAIADELRVLIGTACDKSVIDVLVQEYRKKIGL